MQGLAVNFIQRILAYFYTQLTPSTGHIASKKPFLFKSFHKSLSGKLGNAKSIKTRYTFAP